MDGDEDEEDLPENHLRVISAFDMPRLIYSQERRAFGKYVHCFGMVVLG